MSGDSYDYVWWRIEEVYAETMPMLRAAIRQQASERAP